MRLRSGRLRCLGPAEALVGGPGWLAWRSGRALVLRRERDRQTGSERPLDLVLTGLPDGAALCSGPDWLAVQQGAAWVQLQVSTARLRSLPPRTWPGGAATVRWDGKRFGPADPEGASSGSPLLPEGAGHRGLRPWTAGRGWCWADEDLLFRADARGVVRCAGRTPGAAGPVQAGPFGAMLRRGPSTSWVSLRSQLARRLPALRHLRWDETGARAHLFLDGERAWLCGRSGLVRWAGDARTPVSGARAYDRDLGTIFEGARPVLAGFQHHASAAGPGAVVGPGGRIWTAGGSRPLPALPRRSDKVVALPWGFAWLTRRRIWRLDAGGEPMGPPLDLPRRVGRPLDAAEHDARLVFLSSRGCWSLGPQDAQPLPCPPAWLRGSSERAAGPSGLWLGHGGLLLEERAT